MAKNKKVGIIGHFGGKENFCDGQTVKTKVLHDELKNATDWKLICVDTYYKSKNPLKLIIQTLFCLFICKNVFILLSGNGMKLYFPLLYFFVKLKKLRVFHDVIGGNLDGYVEKYPKFKKYLNSFVVNLVENTALKDRLNLQGITNVEQFPNFKRLKELAQEDLVYCNKKPYPLCTFSRVLAEKGIEDAINAVIQINESAKEQIYMLDIYGPVDPKYLERFEEIKKGFPEYISYKGVIEPEKSVETIKNYFALLFPTKYYTEGIPGTLIDAYAAGVPVISSLWVNHKDIFVENVTGWGYEFGNIDALVEILKKASENPKEFSQMKLSALKESEKYKPQTAVAKLTGRIY